MCIFIGCWLWSIKGHTHRWRQIHVRSRQQTCFSFFMPQKPSINHLNFYCIKQIDNIFPCVCVYCNRSQKTSQRVKNNSHATRLCLVSYFLFFIRCDVKCDLLQDTQTEKCYYLLSTTLPTISNGSSYLLCELLGDSLTH